MKSSDTHRKDVPSVQYTFVESNSSRSKASRHKFTSFFIVSLTDHIAWTWTVLRAWGLRFVIPFSHWVSYIYIYIFTCKRVPKKTFGDLCTATVCGGLRANSHQSLSVSCQQLKGQQEFEKKKKPIQNHSRLDGSSSGHKTISQIDWLSLTINWKQQVSSPFSNRLVLQQHWEY